MKRLSQKGFTILEFVIYVALLGIVVTSAAMFAMHFTITQMKAATYAKASRNAQFAMARIESEVAQATSINVGSSTFGSNPGLLTLVTATGGTNPTVFAVSGGQLTVQQGAGSAVPLTDPSMTVEEFTLENLIPNGRAQYIRVHIKVTIPAGNAFQDVSASVNLDTTVHVRRNDNFTLLEPAYANRS